MLIFSTAVCQIKGAINQITNIVNRTERGTYIHVKVGVDLVGLGGGGGVFG